MLGNRNWAEMWVLGRLSESQILEICQELCWWGHVGKSESLFCFRLLQLRYHITKWENIKTSAQVMFLSNGPTSTQNAFVSFFLSCITADGLRLLLCGWLWLSYLSTRRSEVSPQVPLRTCIFEQDTQPASCSSVNWISQKLTHINKQPAPSEWVNVTCNKHTLSGQKTSHCTFKMHFVPNFAFFCLHLTVQMVLSHSPNHAICQKQNVLSTEI